MTVELLSAVQSAGASGFAPRTSADRSQMKDFVELLSQTGAEAVQNLKTHEAVHLHKHIFTSYRRVIFFFFLWNKPDTRFHA